MLSTAIEGLLLVEAFSTITFTDFVVVAPFESVTVNLTVYVPTFPLLTTPEYSILLVKLPSSLSVAVAPKSEYLNSSPTVKV